MILSPVAAAFAVDYFVGDPSFKFHPVRLMGKAIAAIERRLPRTRVSGLLLALGLPGFCILIPYLALGLAGAWAWSLNMILIFFCLAGKDMLDHARAVLLALQGKDLEKARLAVGRIVGRDTHELDEAGLIRASIESVAESFCDGLVAPLFFAFLGGAPLALGYKAVSTLDSMLGYKNERYRELGWASARLDDLLNYLPARLSALLIAVVCSRPLKALGDAATDGPKQPSPNSGWPEGAFAGALEIQLGGPVSYQGVQTEKAFLGRAGKSLDLGLLNAAMNLYRRASIAAILSGELLWHCLRA